MWNISYHNVILNSKPIIIIDKRSKIIILNDRKKTNFSVDFFDNLKKRGFFFKL